MKLERLGIFSKRVQVSSDGHGRAGRQAGGVAPGDAEGLAPEPVSSRRGGGGGPSGPPAGRAGRRSATAAALVLLAAAGAWAYHANVAAGRPGMNMSARGVAGNGSLPVVLAAVERGAMAGTVTYTGNVAPFAEEDIYPRVTGRIVAMPVYPGDAVRPGQVLARLDDIELASRVREAEAMLATALANRGQMEADLAAAHHGVEQMDKELAMVEAEAAYARAVFARTERLFGSGAVSRQDFESDRAMAAAAEAKRAAARARLEQARAMHAAAARKLDGGQSMAAQSEAVLRTARIVRDYVEIQAPSAGYVVKRLVAPGVLVQPGMAILKLAQIDRVRLQANVGEKDLASLRVGSPVTVTSLGAQSPLAARVTSVFPFVDQGARTAVVEAIVDNPGRRFLPGQYVTMRFVTGERADAWSVPRGAVVRMGGKATVWVAREGRAEPLEVWTGLESAERVEIARGLEGSEQVIARGHEGLYAGARISPVSAPAPSPAGAPAAPAAREPGAREGAAGPGDPGKPKGASHGGH